MAIELTEKADGKILEIVISDKLTKEDYEAFVPEVDRLVEKHGKISILFDMRDFHGWELSAMWEDTKFAARHFRDLDRIAMIGEKKWEKWMAKVCNPFTSAEIRYFDHDHLGDATSWIEG